MIDVAVIDYGVGNLLSVSRALSHCGAQVVVSSDPAVILAASRVVLPGVGAFADGMAALRARGLDQVVHQAAGSGRPLLGICLGMQMLLDDSEEFGASTGLGLVPGSVLAIPRQDVQGRQRKIPHIGWNGLLPPGLPASDPAAGELTEGQAVAAWSGTLLGGLAAREAVYFVHSYMAVPLSAGHRLADCHYDGVAVAAVIRHGNVMGCQFHPEKSGEVGLRVLRNFLQG